MVDIKEEHTLVSVDVETAGPNPAEYSLLSIGVCLVFNPERAFYVELQPVHLKADPQALEVSKLSIEELTVTGTPPRLAMASFEKWLEDNVPLKTLPLFVAFNAPFDWMFVNDYFHRYLGHNPFGHTALDIKAYYMGLEGVQWSETSMDRLERLYLGGVALSHHALQDARDQAELFRKLLAESTHSKSSRQKKGGA